MRVILKCLVIIFPLALFPTTSFAQVNIERNATIHDEYTPRMLNAAATVIRAYGYRCDSISSARPLVWSTGIKVICNQFSYAYLIQDKGGNWVVTLD